MASTDQYTRYTQSSYPRTFLATVLYSAAGSFKQNPKLMIARGCDLGAWVMRKTLSFGSGADKTRALFASARCGRRRVHGVSPGWRVAGARWSVRAIPRRVCPPTRFVNGCVGNRNSSSSPASDLLFSHFVFQPDAEARSAHSRRSRSPSKGPNLSPQDFSGCHFWTDQASRRSRHGQRGRAAAFGILRRLELRQQELTRTASIHNKYTP